MCQTRKYKIHIHKYTNTAYDEVPERPNMWHIFEKRIVQGHQKWYSHVSNTQIQKYKYTNTQIQHMIKCQKDPACGIFLKRGLFKDIKNYIPMCHTRKYWCWCTEGDALKVMQWRWCTEGDALKVMYWRWCTEGDAVKVMHGRWCTEGDALKGINWGWCTGCTGCNGMAMVFNGLQPLVIRWNGNDPSLWSLWNLLQWQWAHAGMLIADCDQFDSALTRRGLLNQYLCENWMLDAVTI